MLDHTADVGFELSAPTLEGLFEEARRALLMLMLEEPPEEGAEKREVSLSASGLEMLLVRWINELVYLIQGEGCVPAQAEVTIRGGRSIEARLTGVPLDIDAHGWKGEIKSATFHDLNVETGEEGWRARVILDV
jgi:SHS2 domain-containing protein